ncbi:MAG TPA: hypothetical protein VH598_03840 [Verrucomicrobiae bacterium]|nr:hypothetical protein [Verrucomicrobiae bacterium]
MPPLAHSIPGDKLPVMSILCFLVLLFFAADARSDTNSPPAEFRVWVFQKGGRFAGRFQQFKGTNQVVLLWANDRKPYSVNISDLSEGDQNFLKTFRAQPEPEKPEKPELVELTAKLIENFPERVFGKPGRMEAVFWELDNQVFETGMDDIHHLLYDGDSLAFAVRDHDERPFLYCLAAGAELAQTVARLKRGDHLVITGKVQAHGGTNGWIDVETIQPMPNDKAPVKAN